MGVRIEWARIADAHLVTEDDDIVDEHGTTMDPGNVGVAAGGCLFEGTRADVLRWAETVVRDLGGSLALDRLRALAAKWDDEASGLRAGHLPSDVDENGANELESSETYGMVQAFEQARDELRALLGEES